MQLFNYPRWNIVLQKTEGSLEELRFPFEKQWKTLCFRKKKPWRFSIVTEKNIPAVKPKSLENS
jgi:hypothetical protein